MNALQRFGDMRPFQWRAARTLALSALGFAVGGCNRGVLDPVGPVASAEKTILINSTAIMGVGPELMNLQMQH